MTFLEEHYGKDYSRATPEELEALKSENEARAAEAEGRDQPVVDHMPTWLNMTNTTRCNLRCIMCNQAAGKIEALTMEKGIYEKIVREFYPFLRVVQLTAIGEPLMTPSLPSKIDDMLRYGVMLEMVTNGVLLEGDGLLEKLARAAHLVIVSLDGATAGTYESIRVGARFEKVMENLRRFNEFREARPPESRPRLQFNYILMRRNIEELPRFVELAAGLGAEAVICNHLVLFEEGLEEEMLEKEPALSNRMTALAADRARELGIHLVVPPPFPEGSEESPKEEEPPGPEEDEPDPGSLGEEGEEGPYRGERCPFLWRRVYLGPRGEVVPCCLAGVESFGSLKETPFLEIWNGPKYRLWRARVHTNRPAGPCGSCYLINRNPTRADFRKTRPQEEN